MPHASTSVVILRPLSELGPGGGRATRADRTRARAAAQVGLDGRMGVNEMLDRAIEVLRDHFALMVGLAALAWLPVRALQPFIGPHTWEQSAPDTVMVGSSLSSLVSTASSALAQCFSSAMLARLVHDSLIGAPARAGHALREVLARLHVVVGVALLSTIATTLGLCACFLPSILLSWKLSVAPMACVIEGSGVRASLSRSWLLTRRGFWRWVFLVLAAAALGLPFSGLGSLADWPGMRGQALAWSGLSGTAFDLVYALLSSLMLGVASALQAVVLTVYYTDCRMRREGSDLELLQARVQRAEVPS